MAFQLLALTGVWASCVSLFNGEKSRKIQSEHETKRRETQLEMEYLRMNHQANLESARQAFQKKVVEYQCENSLRVQQFVKTVDLMLAKNQQEFQAWQAEQQRKLQQELAGYNRETQLAVAAYQRETTRKMAEFNKILDNWPLRLFPSEIIGFPSQEKAIPLRIIIAPPEIDYDRFGIANKDFPKLEKRLAQGVRGFVENHYSLNSQERPTEFLGGAWDSNRFHSEASIKRLFTMLKSEPTLILESEVDGEYINLRLAYWSGGQDLYGYKTVISKLGHLEMVKAFAKARMLEGKTEKELPKDAKIEHNAKDFEKFCEFLVACHQLLAGLFADVHYLIHYNRSLQLPSLLPEVMKSFPDHQVAKEMIQWIVNGYRDAFKVLKMDRSYWIPDLMLELAQGLAGLEDKSWAKELVEESGREWLRLRGIVPSDNGSFNTIKPLLTQSDKKFLEKLKHCSSLIEDSQNLDQMTSFLEASELLGLEETQDKEIVQPNQNLIAFHSETTKLKQEKMMDFKETKSKALSVINQLREVAKVSMRNVLKDADGKFKKDLNMLEDQINTTRFTVGVVGVFNTGKSTFLNALLRRELLSTKILPETAAITTLNYGEEDKATVSYWTTEDWKAIEAHGKAADQGNKPSKITKMVNDVRTALGAKFNKLITPGGEKTENIPLTDLEKYTSANAKGGYAKLVKEVEITTNLEFCKDNLRIVDTPGLNDPVQFREHVTVDQFLPNCDMLVLLLPARQAFTEYDRRFLEKQLKKGQLHKLFVIVNQIDLLQAKEVGEVIDFTRLQLKETFEEGEADLVGQLEIFPMSANESFLNRTGQSAKWTDEQSGVPAFEARLRKFLLDGERAKTEQKSWQTKLGDRVKEQFQQIDAQLDNLDKPIKELEETIKEVRKEHDYIRDRMERVSLEVDKTLTHFERQYQDQAEIMSERIKGLATPIGKEAGQKVDQFLEKNVFSVMHQTEKWCKNELGPSLQKAIENEVEDVVSDTGKRVQQLVEETLKDFQTSWKNMVNDVKVHLPVKTSVGGSYASLIGSGTLGFLASMSVAGGVMGLAGVTPAAMTALLAGPVGWIILGISAIATAAFAVFAAGSIKEKTRSQMRDKLSQEIPGMMSKIASETRKKFLDKKYDLVKELRKVAEAPAIEIKAQLQQQEANLNQLLNDKKSQEVDIQKQREAITVEKTRFEQVLVEINAMV